MNRAKKIGCAVIAGVLALGLAACGQGQGAKGETLDFSSVEVSELRVDEAPRTSLRGLAASTDGKCLYGGYIKGEPRGVHKLDAETGEEIWYYQDKGYTQPGFCKGVAADDRGDVYGGVTIWEQLDEAQLAVVSDETGEEISLTPIRVSGKVGTNGVAVRKDGDRYLLYLITNYDVNRIYCYDVTDVNTPVPNEEFGAGGFIELSGLTGGSAEATCIAFAEDGSFYLTANLGGGNKGDTVLHVAADGKKVLGQAALGEAYGLTLHGTYVFVSTYLDGTSAVHVLERDGLKEIAQVGNLPDCTQYAGVAFANGRLYIADQTYQEGSRILVSNVIPEAGK